MTRHRYWRYWAKALGEKAGETDYEADKVAIIRTVLAGFNVITCVFIIANIVHNW